MKYSHINRILVAEDQAINMEVVKRQITRVGLLERTELYYNGQDAFERVIQILDEAKDCPSPIDLMLIDQQMPLMKGIELVKNVKAEID